MGKTFRIVLYCIIAFLFICTSTTVLIFQITDIGSWSGPIPLVVESWGIFISMIDVIQFSVLLIGICLMLALISKKYYEKNV